MDVAVEDSQGSLFCHAIFRYHRVSMAGQTRAIGVAAALALCAWTALAAPRAPTAKPTPVPTPVPPPRELEPRKGALSPGRQRFLSRDLTFSMLLRVEEVDLDRDGDPEFLVEGIGTVKRIPEDVTAIDFVSRLRLPFESPILAILKRAGDEWRPLLLAHVPLKCGQSDDLATCDQLIQFRSVRFRYDDRPQVVLQILHSGETGSNASYAYRLDKGRLETTFSVALPRSSVDVSIDPIGITRRLAVDTFVNRELPARYRSFTLKSLFLFGESHFRVSAESVEEPWGDRSDAELAYWGLVHQPTFSVDLERLRERGKKDAPEAWTLDALEVVKKRYPDATRIRMGTKFAGVCVVYFQRGACHAHAVLYQPLREWDGEKSPWEVASLRGQKDNSPFECLDEPPLAFSR
jgi:hypothetical protein